MAKDLDLSGLDDIYTDKEGNSKKVDLSGVDDVYSPKKEKSKEEEKPFYARPVIPPGTARDLVSGIGEHLPLIPQIMGAGDVINKSLSGEIDPTDTEQLKKAYEAGRTSLPKIQDKATENSPIANRIGQAAGLVGGASLGGASVKGIAGLGGLMAASQGNTPIIAGTDKDRDKALGEIETGVGLGGALGLGGKLAGKAAETALSSPAAKAFLAASKGAKLTGSGAIDEAGQALLGANEDASQGVEGLRQQVGQARDVIENAQANQNIDLSDSLEHMANRFEGLTGSERVEAEKSGLMDLLNPNNSADSAVNNSGEMSLKDGLDMRSKLRGMSQDPDLHPMVRQAARDGLSYLQSDLKSQVPELAQNDAQYAALKNAQKLFGKKYNAQDQLVQSTKQANLLDRASKESINGVSAKQQLAGAIDQVRKVSPDLADKMESSLNGSLENFNLTKTANAPDINMTSMKQSLNKSSAWLGAKAGEAANSISNTPVLRASKSLYSAGDDALRSFSQKMSSSGGQTGEMLSKALDNALDNKNTMAKNAILFSIMQNPMLRNLVGTDHEEGP